jgi:hypothetical protein
MMTKIVLESAYFHIHNGGLSLSVREETGDHSSRYFLEADCDNFGGGISVNIPLGNLEVVSWLHTAMGRVLSRMIEKQPKNLPPYLRPWEPFTAEARACIEDGTPADYYFRVKDGVQQKVSRNWEQAGQQAAPTEDGPARPEDPTPAPEAPDP